MIRKFRKYLIEPLKIDSDNEEVFVELASDGDTKPSENRDSENDSSVAMAMDESCCSIAVGIYGDDSLEKEEDKCTTPLEEGLCSNMSLLGRQPSWSLRRKRSSRRKRDFFRYFFFFFFLSREEDLIDN